VEMTKTLPSSSQQGQDNDHDSTFSFSRNGPHGGAQPTSEDALEVLRELVEVLLDCVHLEHTQDVAHLAADAIAACVEEFDGGVPIPILDEILKCIGTGSVVQVTNPEFIKASAVLAHAKKKKKKKNGKEDVKLPNRFVAQTNPSYMVAKRVIEKTLDRISTPIANLLNGLLDGDANVIKDSDIVCDPPVERKKGGISDSFGGDPEEEEKENDGSETVVDVWTIVYELHKIAPGILTTVIGTVASSLKHVDFNKRFRSTRLLGRLFYSKTSDIAVSFHLCYKEWIRRSFDKNQKIREVMVRHLLAILRNKSTVINVCEEATDALVRMVTHDPQVDIRLKCIAGICEVVYEIPAASSFNSSAPYVSSKLLKAVGDRVMSKTKKERLDSITGLVKIYNRNFILPKLKDVERGGDDCSIDIILDIIRGSCDFSIYDSDDGPKPMHEQKKGRSKNSLSPPVGLKKCSDSLDEMYSFIPELLFQCFSISDSSDPALRNRILTLMDDVILGTEIYHKGHDGKKRIKKTMTPTSRAVGLTIIINHLQSLNNIDGTATKENSVYQWLLRALSQRQILQRKLRLYLDAKAQIDNVPKDSEERMEANASAFQKLEAISKLTSPPNTNMTQSSSDDLKGVLEKVHSAKDRHIFRREYSLYVPSANLIFHFPLIL
jgi:hypothetical protein